MKPLISTFAIALGLATFGSSVQAEQVCMTMDEMGAALIDWYGERPIAEPSPTNEQIWVSQTTGTWTMVKMYADGHACVIAQGEDWNGGLSSDEMFAQLSE